MPLIVGDDGEGVINELVKEVVEVIDEKIVRSSDIATKTY